MRDYSWDYWIGETKTWRCRPMTGLGEPADLTDAHAELRVSLPQRACLVLPAVTDAEGFLFTFAPADLPTAPGRYAVALWIRWGDGTLKNHMGGHLTIRKGC